MLEYSRANGQSDAWLVSAWMPHGDVIGLEQMSLLVLLWASCRERDWRVPTGRDHRADLATPLDKDETIRIHFVPPLLLLPLLALLCMRGLCS